MAKVINFPQCYNGTLFEHADGTPRRSWLWVEWEIDGGIQRIVEEWQGGILRHFDGADVSDMVAMAIEPDIEKAALSRIHKEARALQQYQNGRYRDLLNPMEQKILELELECMQERPHLHGHDVYRWIAEQMNGHNWGWRMVESALEEINDVLRAYYDYEMQRKLNITLLEFRRVWNEVTNELQTVQRAA